MALLEHGTDNYVSAETGEIDRRIFSDPDIYEAEMELIFGRAWLFLCHESQIPKSGDFFEAPMGKDNVLVVRQRDGSIRALLNTCTHRGNAVCRADEGNTKNFMCTYHGWTFSIDGDLIGVPGFENLYHSELDKSALGLRQVAQIDTYRGFIFATMDPSAPSLYDFLGGTSRLSLDLIALRGDLQAIPGVQKFVINCNWKFAVDNLFDWYHAQITHMSANGLIGIANEANTAYIDSGGAETPDGVDVAKAAGQLATNDTNICVIGEYGHAIGGPDRQGFENLIGKNSPASLAFSQTWRDTEEIASILGPVGMDVAGHQSIFPTTWISNLQISLRVPRGPQKTEIWWYTFAPKEMTPEARAVVVGMANHVFGPAGFLEQEDGENWAQSTMQTTGYMSKRIPNALKMDLGRAKLERDPLGFSYSYGQITEHPQLWTYLAWQEWMRASSWDELRRATEPPAVL
jgi:3-phenylpropionate/trans-cinnamate dioxygenase alpha subunit